MNAATKSWTGAGLALALLAWSAAGGWALWKLQSDEGVDPRAQEPCREAAVLGDRLEALAADTTALTGAIERGFEGLAQALDERSAASERGARELAERVAALERELTRAVADSSAAARARTASAAPAARATAGPAEAPHGTEAAAEAGLAEVAGAAPIAPTEPPSAPAPEPAAGRSFLAFALPAREQGFEGLRTWEVLGDLSRVGFDAKSTLHDFSGTSERVRGSLRVDLARPEQGIEGRIEIDAASLSTADGARDEEMGRRLESARFATIAFTPTGFRATGGDPAERRVVGRVRGRMAIHGVERDLELPVVARLDEARRLVIEGEAALQLSDFGITAPSKLGLISMENGVKVWIHLRARARLGEAG